MPIASSRLPGATATAVTGCVLLLLTVAAGPASAATTSRVSARLTANRVHPGKAVSVTGRAQPGSGRLVSLQQRSGSGWATVRSARTGRNGSYSIPVASSWTGSVAYRVHVAGAGSARGADSAPFTFVVAGLGSSSDVHYLSGSAANPARWDPCVSVGYRVNTSGATAGALADVKGAAARINRVSGLHLTYRGSTRLVPTGHNAGSYPADTDIVIAWVRPGQTSFIPRGAVQVGTGGASWRSWRVGGRTYSRMDAGMVVLSTSSNSLPAGFGSGRTVGWLGTRGQMLLHELGHAVGLNHAKDASQVMYPILTRKLASFGAGDAVGLHKLGRASGCFPAVLSRVATRAAVTRPSTTGASTTRPTITRPATTRPGTTGPDGVLRVGAGTLTVRD